MFGNPKINFNFSSLNVFICITFTYMFTICKTWRKQKVFSYNLMHILYYPI
jgi:hypothetical protein